jgi:hypothetical protein
MDNARVSFTRGEVDRAKLGLVNSTYDSGFDVRLTWPNSLDAGGNFDFADVYVDFTAARVEISDGTKTEIQPVTAWSPASIQFVFNKGELTGGPATLYVYDANDVQLGAGVAVLVN